MKEIKVGFIGIGSRGCSLLRDVVLAQGEKVTAVCDIYRDRLEEGVKFVVDAGQEKPAAYLDYHQVIADENVNTVIIVTAWESHVDIAVEAMNAGKAVAMEVGGYQHDLRNEIAFGRENRHYRLRNYLNRNCENYPTHDLGPIARILKINHGNRMMHLSSVSSKAAGLHEYILSHKAEDETLKNARFAQGDIVTTVITCAGGETIVLTLDTTLPRYYSRNFTVRGTKGMYEEATDSVFLDREEDIAHDFDWRKKCNGNAEQYEEAYDHPVWKEYLERGVKGTHDGMDWLEFWIFFKALREGEPMPVDVYDAASWMAITQLSEMSIQKGGAVVDIPDFTNGKWMKL